MATAEQDARRKLIEEKLVGEATPSGKDLTKAILAELFELADNISDIRFFLAEEYERRTHR